MGLSSVLASKAFTQCRMAVHDFCYHLSGDMLAACQEIPARCISVRAPHFIEAIGDAQLFLAMRDVLRKAHLGHQHHHIYVLGAGRGTTGTHTTAQAASANNRTVAHYDQLYHNRVLLRNRTRADLANAHHALRLQHNNSHGPPLLDTRALIKPLTTTLSSLITQWNVTGFFDSPWTHYFSELFFATCPLGVRVVVSVRDSLAWAISRQAYHRALQQEQDGTLLSAVSLRGRRLSKSGFICPYAMDPRLLDPFSLTQCAAFARRLVLAPKKTNQTQGPAPQRLPGSAALDVDDLETHALAQTMHKYNQYVQRLVPEETLLRVDLFSSSLLPNSTHHGESYRDEWTRLQSQLIATFVREDQ